MAGVGNYFENKYNGLKMEKNCFRWELNSKPFTMAKVGNYFENRKNCQKKKKIAFGGN